MESKEVELFSWQKDWADRAYQILLNNYGYIDTSQMRSGKTYITLWLAKKFNFSLIVICPVTTISFWKEAAEEYNVEIVYIMSYQKLRGKKNSQPKHGLLERYEKVSGNKFQIVFEPTEDYLKIVEHGIFVIFDEIQMIKNNNDQYKACSALIRPILNGGLSRFGLLSGTPFDKEKHVINLLRMIGYIRSPHLYRSEGNLILLDSGGFNELFQICKSFDKEATYKVMRRFYTVTKTNIITICYHLFIEVIKKRISGAMVSPIENTMDIKNGFYKISEGRKIQLRNAIDELKDVIRYISESEITFDKNTNMGRITTALMNIENAKVNDFARVAIKHLNNNCKVIISVNYTKTINELRKLLSLYNPVILNGSVPQKERSDIIKQFTNNPNVKLLIMNTAVGSLGISLYSKTLNVTIWMLLSPNYNLLELTQAAARIFGPGMKSTGHVRMFYGSGEAEIETSILTSLTRKTLTLKGTLENKVVKKLILPGDYEAEYEQD